MIVGLGLRGRETRVWDWVFGVVVNIGRVGDWEVRVRDWNLDPDMIFCLVDSNQGQDVDSGYLSSSQNA